MKDKRLDCRFTRDGNWFSYRAGAIIIEDGCVLLATNEKVGYYYSIGGGVHLGETAQEAAEREAFEETGVKYEAERLAFVHENMFVDNESRLKGLTCHEIAFYYIMKPRGVKEIRRESSECRDGKEHVVFVPIDELKNLTVFPEFYKDKLKDIPPFIEHVLTR